MMNNNRKSRSILGAGTLLLVGSLAIPAIASEFSGGYVGVDAGAAREKLSGNLSAPYKTTGAGGVEGGYNWDIGEAGLLVGVNGFLHQTHRKSRTITDNVLSLSGDGTVGSKTYGIDGKVGYAMDKWLPYVKLGFGMIKGTGDLDGRSNGLHAGLGAEYKIADHWSVGGELSHFRGKEEQGTKLTNNSLFLTLKYYFDSPAAVAAPVAAVAAMPEPTPEPAPAPAVKPAAEKVSVAADALFDFDKAVLRPEGKAKVDEVVEKSTKLKIEAITAVGHADRLGSAEYNQKLSERRAESVKNYMVEKGIAADAVYTEGKGSTQPVTKAEDCAGPKSKKVVECLQPDRRVDIEIIGTESK